MVQMKLRLFLSHSNLNKPNQYLFHSSKNKFNQCLIQNPNPMLKLPLLRFSLQLSRWLKLKQQLQQQKQYLGKIQYCLLQLRNSRIKF